MMSSVCAVEFNNTNTLSTDDGGSENINHLAIDYNDDVVNNKYETNNATLMINNDDDQLGDDVASFNDLNSEISSSSNIVLSHKYYKFVSGQSSAIDIDNKIIDGNGTTIDGSDLAYPFKSSGNVTLKNIIFINVLGKTKFDNHYRGGPVLFNDGSNNVVFDNCVFKKLKTTVDGIACAIGLYDAVNVTIKNCNFSDNTMFNSLVI